MLVTVGLHLLTGPPARHSSGKYKGKSKVSNKANKKVKALFHNGAMSAIQHCAEIKAYYNRKINEGKHHMVVVNNICNNGAARAVSASYFRLYFSKRKI
jgi:hypothetical protein